MSYLGEADQTYTNGDGSILRSYNGKNDDTFASMCAFAQAQGYLLYSEH